MSRETSLCLEHLLGSVQHKDGTMPEQHDAAATNQPKSETQVKKMIFQLEGANEEMIRFCAKIAEAAGEKEAAEQFTASADALHKKSRFAKVLDTHITAKHVMWAGVGVLVTGALYEGLRYALREKYPNMPSFLGAFERYGDKMVETDNVVPIRRKTA